MTETAQRLKTELAALPQKDRAELAQILLHSLEVNELEGNEAWEIELERRMDEICVGNAVGEPAESVFAQLREKYS